MAETCLNKPAGRLIARGFAVPAKNYGQQACFAALGRDDKVVARCHGPAGLQTVDAFHRAQQGVGIAQGAPFVHEKARTVKTHGRGVGPQVSARKQHHVTGRGFLAGGRQTGRIFEKRAAHAERAGFAIHPEHEITVVAAPTR